MSEDEDVRGVFQVENTAVAAAALGQEQAEVIDILRKSKNFSVTAIYGEENNDVTHISFLHDEEEFIPFLSFVAIRAIEDLAKVMERPNKEAVKFLAMLMSSKEDW